MSEKLAEAAACGCRARLKANPHLVYFSLMRHVPQHQTFQARRHFAFLLFQFRHASVGLSLNAASSLFLLAIISFQ